MKRNDTYETEEIEKDGLRFRIDWIVDYDNPADYLGKCFGKKTAHEPYVDRREGILYSGEILSETRTFTIVEKAIGDTGSHSTFQYQDGMYLLCETTDDLGWLKTGEKNNDFDGYPEVHDDVFPRAVTVLYYIYEVLADNLSTDRDRNSYEYWGKCQNLPHHPGNWQHVSQDEIDKCWNAAQHEFEKHGIHPSGNKAMDMDVYYACEDYELQQRLYPGYWCYLGCVATLVLGGEDFVDSCLWSIESDADRPTRQSKGTSLPAVMSVNWPTLKDGRSMSCRSVLFHGPQTASQTCPAHGYTCASAAGRSPVLVMTSHRTMK